MNSWGWQPQRSQGIWRHGAAWLHPFVVVAPYLTVFVLLMMFYFIGNTLVAEKGMMIELPAGERVDGSAAELVALVMPMKRETLVFFDDTRYLIGDEASMESFRQQLAERVGNHGDKPLLVLADRRVPGGELMKLASVARRSGVAKLLIAERSAEVTE